MNINKEMAEHMVRYYLEYPHEHLTREDKDAIVLIKYLMGEIEELKEKINKEKK